MANKKPQGAGNYDVKITDTGHSSAKVVDGVKTTRSKGNYGTGSVKETIVSGGM